MINIKTIANSGQCFRINEAGDGRYKVVAFGKVAYVSSAGLRALLIGQKTANSKGGSMTLTNVQEAVAQVFEMSGFSGILTIE